MKRSMSLLLAFLIILLLYSCGKKDSVVKEIYTGSKYMTIEEAKQYVLRMLGENANLYKIDVYKDLVRFSLKEDINETDWLSRSISFADGTDITLPCAYSDISTLGWKSEENINNDRVSGELVCRNNQGQRIFLTRAVDSDENNIKIKDSTIEGLRIPCCDFSKKDNYAQILSSHPNFSYMNINRESAPKEATRKIGYPNTIEHNGTRMYFEYESYDYSVKEKTIVEIDWLTMSDGPEIMGNIEIRRFYMSWLLY